MLFKLYVVRESLSGKTIQFTRQEVAALRDDELPVYTILIPLYKEAEVIGQIRNAMTAIDYPPEKLDIIITLEEYDHETIEAIERADLPSHFKTLILPNVKPKTKPKALNVAFHKVKGEFFVIYDAEIIPDPDQLKKAVLAFRSYEDIACLQTRLDHYNATQSWITKLFNAEFSFYYDLFLPGLQKLNFPLPLSGHSTHFRAKVLRDIGCWDPYNVAEDCDVGMRLFRAGYRADMLDSLSQEEATCDVRAWTCQRSRWMKGFIQTTIVHLRHPLRFKDDLGGWRNFLAFLIIVPGSVALNLLNLVYGALLILWFTTHSPLIQAYFPGPILYVSIFSFIAGNFVFTYLNLLGSYSLLSFVYWFMLAYATVRASVQLIFKPHHWEKTTHGQHLLVPTPHAIP
jgi:glycosyltransferase XagB